MEHNPTAVYQKGRLHSKYDNRVYTCTVRKDMGQMETARYTLTVAGEYAVTAHGSFDKKFIAQHAFIYCIQLSLLH